jgi:hypothetical protein
MQKCGCTELHKGVFGDYSLEASSTKSRELFIVKEYKRDTESFGKLASSCWTNVVR